MSALRALLVLLAAFPAAASAAEEGYPLQEANADVSNLASLQRGARDFVNYCQGCHSAKYMRYSQLATDLALTEDDVKRNLMFTGERIYDTMQSVMPPEQARHWFGNAPPDLSLIVRSRGPDYVYTFLRSFYDDPSRPTGVNNAVLPGTAMPHVLAPLQGVQRARHDRKDKEEGGGMVGFGDGGGGGSGGGNGAGHIVLEPGTPGDMPAATFDSFVLFLLMFAAFAWFLYKEYWKDVA